MIEITLYPAFIRAFKKCTRHNPNLKSEIRDKIEIFKINPFDSRLKTHKLSGKLQDLYSFSLDYDYRIIFSFFEKEKVIFENIGKHDEVY